LNEGSGKRTSPITLEGRKRGSRNKLAWEKKFKSGEERKRDAPTAHELEKVKNVFPRKQRQGWGNRERAILDIEFFWRPAKKGVSQRSGDKQKRSKAGDGKYAQTPSQSACVQSVREGRVLQTQHERIIPSGGKTGTGKEKNKKPTKPMGGKEDILI